MNALRTKIPTVRVATRTLRNVRFISDDGSTGSFRGSADGDSFTKREKGAEDYYVRQHEKEQLVKLRAEIESREKDLADLKEKASKLSN